MTPRGEGHPGLILTHPPSMVIPIYGYLRSGNDEDFLAIELSDTPYAGTLWLRYNNELVANKRIPPKVVKKHLVETLKYLKVWDMRCEI